MLHGQGQEGRQAVLHLAQHDAHARLHLPPAEVSGDDERTSNYDVEEAGMAQMDDSVGELLQAPGGHRRGRQHHRHLHHRQRRRSVHLAGWRHDAVQGHQGHLFEGGFRVPAIIRWPGHVKPGSVENGIFSGLDWFPTLADAAGNPDITDQLLKGVKLGGQTYKNHLDGYDQMDLLLGKGPSARHELFYFGGPQLGAIRIDDFKFQFFQQPYGWPGEKVTTDMPTIVNLRQDPFERTPSIRGETLNDMGGGYMNDFMAREFWRFVVVQQVVAKRRRRRSTIRRCRPRRASTSKPSRRRSRR